MTKAAQVTLWVGTAALFATLGAVIGIHRKDVGRFIAGEQVESVSPIEPSSDHKPVAAESVRAVKVTASDLPAPPPPPPKPVEGWRPVKTETVELNPLTYRVLGTTHSPTKTKISIDAESAVFFGVFQQSALEEFARRKQLLRQNDFAQSKCGEVGVVQTEFECELAEGDVLVLRDKRAEGSQLLGAFGFLKGNNQAVNNATAGNKVKYEIDIWGCVQNCESGQASQPPKQ